MHRFVDINIALNDMEVTYRGLVESKVSGTGGRLGECQNIPAKEGK